MVIISKGRDYTIHKVKATENGNITEIEKEISCWNGIELEIKIKRIY